MNVAERIRQLLREHPSGLYAREIASKLAVSRETVVAALQEDLAGEVSADGSTWRMGASKHAEVLAELRDLLRTYRWSDFDRRLASAGLEEIHRDQALEWKAHRLAERIPAEARPDADQARVIASPARTIRVTARAGSGKTRLLAATGHFLVRECGYRPDEVLILAFNRDAAAELEARLTRLLAIPSFPGVRTFHALAHGLVRPAEEILHDEGLEVANRALSLFVQQILAESLDAVLMDPVYSFFREETEEARSTGAFLGAEEAYHFRRDLRHVTLGGLRVKSVGEKIIGDFLFEHGIEFQYEFPVFWDDGWYRPDFRLKCGEQWIIWEHWAVDPDALDSEPSHHWPAEKLEAYRTQAHRKREYWRAQDTLLLETNASQSRDRGGFEFVIERMLRSLFPNLRRRPSAELFAAVKAIHLSKLSTWLVQGVQRVRKRGWDRQEFAHRVGLHGGKTEREGLFLELLDRVIAAYDAKLAAEGKTDFDRLFQQALDGLEADSPNTMVRGRQTRLDLRAIRYCLVDEAQDLSDQFLALLTAVRRLSPGMRLILVGDDWQAINRFAGSAVELFTGEVTRRFAPCAAVVLETNYRSAAGIVAAGNRLMANAGPEAGAHAKHSGRIELVQMDHTWVERRSGAAGWASDAPFREFGLAGAAFLKTLYQLAIPELCAGHSVGVLFRTNHFAGASIEAWGDRFTKLLRAFRWPEDQSSVWVREKLRFSTVHRAKGAQWHTVFVIDPVSGSFPLIQPDAVELFRVFGDSVERAEEDERRLFYVAITRAEERLVFVTEAGRADAAPYLEPVRALMQLISVPKTALAPGGGL